MKRRLKRPLLPPRGPPLAADVPSPPTVATPVSAQGKAPCPASLLPSRAVAEGHSAARRRRSLPAVLALHAEAPHACIRASQSTRQPPSPPPPSLLALSSLCHLLSARRSTMPDTHNTHPKEHAPGARRWYASVPRRRQAPRPQSLLHASLFLLF